MVCPDPSDAGPLRRGLEAEGVPLEVIDESTATATDLHRMAMALTDQVTVTDRWCVSGLERRVIVGVEGWGWWCVEQTGCHVTVYQSVDMGW